MSNKVPEGWKLGLFGDLAKVQNGYAFKSAEFSDTGYAAAIRMSNLKLGRVDLSDAKYVSQESIKGLDQFQLASGDFLFGMSGSLDNYAWVKKTDGICYLNQRVGCLRIKPQADPLYTSYCYLSGAVKDAIVGLAAGAAQLNISGNQLQEISILIPPLPEQQKIATILSSVDEVIEKTRAQIDKLKDLKTGMMQELLTKGIGHTEFKDSPVGRIPAEWECKKIDQLAGFVTSGSRGWAQYYSEAGPIFIRIGNLTREHINLRFNDTVYVSPPDSAEGKRTQVQLGDVLISITADLGVIGVINESIGEAYVNQHVSLVRLSDPTMARWVGHFLAFENTQKQFIENNDAGAKAGLNLSAIRNTMVAIPWQHEREKIVATLDSIDRDIVMKRSMLGRVFSIKNALMQDLLTGKVRVKTQKDMLKNVE